MHKQSGVEPASAHMVWFGDIGHHTTSIQLRGALHLASHEGSRNSQFIQAKMTATAASVIGGGNWHAPQTSGRALRPSRISSLHGRQLRRARESAQALRAR